MLFYYLWITEIPAYIINLVINFFLRKINYFTDYRLDFFIVSIAVFILSSIISILIYCFYSRVFNKSKNSQKDKTIKVNRICGHIIYLEEKVQGTRNTNLEIKELDLGKNNAGEESVEQIYLKNQTKICCYSGKLGAKKFLRNAKYTILPLFCCCCFNCFCKLLFRCFCCYNENEELSELNQGNERFCYFYKIQREVSWFCDLLFKENILNLIIYNIINELIIIGFLKQLNNSLKTNEFDLISNIMMILSFLIYFTFIAFLNKIITKRCLEGCAPKVLKKDNEDSNSDEYVKQRWSTEILTIFNVFFTTIFSGFLLFGNDTLIDITLNYLITLPIAMTKFYNLILTNCLLNSMDYGNIDLLSNSMMISLFLTVYHLLSFLITDFIDVKSRILIIIQFSIGIIILFLYSIHCFKGNLNCDCCDCCDCDCCKNPSKNCDCSCSCPDSCCDCDCCKNPFKNCDCSCSCPDSCCDCCDCDCCKNPCKNCDCSCCCPYSSCDCCDCDCCKNPCKNCDCSCDCCDCCDCYNCC